MGRFVLLIILLILSCHKKENKEENKLLVFISVDQWRYDLLERYKQQYKHGFKRIWDKARIYSNALHDFSSTETGPGHSVLLSGNYPAQTGIVRNRFYDRRLEKKLYCVQDDSAKIIGSENYMGISPKNLLVPTLGDLMKKRNSASKVASVAGKDRSSVLMAGHKADRVFWYGSKDGNWISSDYYMEELPDYILKLNKNKAIDKYFNTEWKKKFDIDYKSLSREDNFKGEADNVNNVFPHKLKGKSGEKPDAAFYNSIKSTPFLDEYTLLAAKEIVENEKLGSDDISDLLIIGLSATDYVGHKYGPYSQEMLDHLMRIDEYLGDFFAFLDSKLGENGYLVIMSADHGAAPVPEHSAANGKDAKRILRSEFEEDLLKIKKKFNLDESFDFDKIIESSFPADKRDLILTELRKLPYVGDLFTFDELKNPNTPDRPFLTDYKKSFYPDRSDNIEYIPKKYYLVPAYGVGGTSHGTAYKYDQHIPILFMGHGIENNVISEQVKTVDIAPTLAKKLGLVYNGFKGSILF